MGKSVSAIIDTENKEQVQALELIAHTNSSFFLTGRAGTGKTTFLQNVQKQVGKQFVVVAPTGVAAILAGGDTIHSFFGLPMNVCDSDTYGRLNEERLSVIRHTDTIIVDEASMVRCDIVDAMDRTLRKAMNTNLPFGGKQMVFVGDMFQLPPIVKAGPERECMRELYHSDDFFFYKAWAIRRMHMVKIEFRKVYRQDDVQFLRILENVRMNQMAEGDLALLNTRVCMPREEDGMVITLASLNRVADSINQKRLGEIDSEEFTYEGTVNGKFEEKRFPVDKQLKLKVGAQVMFTRNDQQRRWVNGTLGRVSELTSDKILVETQDGGICAVPVCSWESVTYEYDKKTHKLAKNVAGTFMQYPLKLAWAITIHKSQGMTFDKMVLDLSHDVFAEGQLYVALSRVRSMGGLFLSCPVESRYAKTNKSVLTYAIDYNDVSQISNEIESGKAVYDLLQRNDYDEAARQYLLLVKKRTEDGDIKGAMQQAKRMLDIMVSDEHLYGCVGEIPLVPGDSGHWAVSFLVSLLSLYANRYDEALEHVDQVLAVHQCMEAMFVKARCLTKMARCKEADETYALMGERGDCILNDAKVLYAAAMFNEQHTSDSGVLIAKQLVTVRPKYDKGILLLRSLMKKHGIALGAEKPNVLLDSFCSDMTDEEFGYVLRQSRSHSPKDVECLTKELQRCLME